MTSSKELIKDRVGADRVVVAQLFQVKRQDLSEVPQKVYNKLFGSYPHSAQLPNSDLLQEFKDEM